MWLNLLSLGVKTGAKLYQNKQRTKQLISDAQMLHAEKMRAKLSTKQKLLKVMTMGLKMNLSLFLYLCLFLYWVILFSLTTLKFVIN